MRNTAPYSRPNADTVCSMPALLYFIWEREVIRIVRDRGGERPYTKDPVLAKYKFTNIRRRDDRVSRWIIEHIIKPNEDRQDLWFILLITRLINWPPTLQRLIDDGILFRAAGDFEPQAFSESVERFKNEGNKVYSGAYMVYPTKMDPGGNKSQAIAKHIITPALSLSNRINAVLQDDEPLIADFVAELSSSFGISTFMAGQVAADLTYASEGQLSRASDLFTFAPIGPGSSRGLNYLLNRAPNVGWSQEAFNAQLIKIRDAVVDELEIDDLTLHDVQNCMCEFSKYCRTVLGEGKPKTTYQPETEF
jgi:hypothetical protein